MKNGLSIMGLEWTYLAVMGLNPLARFALYNSALNFLTYYKFGLIVCITARFDFFYYCAQFLLSCDWLHHEVNVYTLFGGKFRHMKMWLDWNVYHEKLNYKNFVVRKSRLSQSTIKIEVWGSLRPKRLIFDSVVECIISFPSFNSR